MTDFSNLKIKIAKQGKTIDDDPNDLIFSSDFLTPKIYLKGGGNFTSDNMSSEYPFLSEKRIRHGLGYPPAFLTYVKKNRKWQSNKWNYANYVDENYLYFHGEPGERGFYFIFFDPAVELAEGGVNYTKNSKGIYIAKGGKTLENAKAHELAYNSDWDTIMIQNQIRQSFIGKGGGTYTTTVKVEHGCGYSPAFIPAIRMANEILTLPYSIYINGVYDEWNVEVDETYVYAYRVLQIDNPFAWIPPDEAVVTNTVLFTEELK